MYFVEALAHQVRGATIMFFLLWTVYLYHYRTSSRMMKVMFITAVCLCLGFAKDSLYLFESIRDTDWLDTIVSILDMSAILVACNFFCEAVKHNSTKSGWVWLWPVSELIFIPVYLICPQLWVIIAAYMYCFLLLIVTAVYMIFYSVKHKHYIESHYSSHENITVRWVVSSGIFYITCFIVYFFVFGINGSGWLGETLYSLLCMVIWTYIFFIAKSHRVVDSSEADDEAAPETAPEPVKAATDRNTDSEYDPAALQYIRDMIEPKLTDCMQNGKLFLNPNLSLKAVATEIGSNTKYLSVYLNRCLGVSFYDYINNFRVEKACSIFREMVKSGRINMPEVSERSGFNSVSTFNRYFKKVKGLAPKDYYKRCLEER